MTLAILLVLCSWIAWADSRDMIIPDQGILLGLTLISFSVLIGYSDSRVVLGGMAIAGLQFLTVYVILPRKLGLGDVKFAILLGALFGPIGWLVCAGIGMLTALIHGAALSIQGRQLWTDRIPLAPFLTLGGWGAFIGGFPL